MLFDASSSAWGMSAVSPLSGTSGERAKNDASDPEHMIATTTSVAHLVPCEPRKDDRANGTPGMSGLLNLSSLELLRGFSRFWTSAVSLWTAGSSAASRVRAMPNLSVGSATPRTSQVYRQAATEHVFLFRSTRPRSAADINPERAADLHAGIGALDFHKTGTERGAGISSSTLRRRKPIKRCSVVQFPTVGRISQHR